MKKPTATTYERLYKELRSTVPMAPDELQSASTYFETIHLKKRKNFYKQGEICPHIAFINKGCLRHYHVDSKGEEQTVYFAFEGWWVGDLLSYFSSIPSSFTLQALEDSELFALSKSKFDELCADIPQFHKFYRIKTERSYTALQLKITEQNSVTAEEKYSKLLQDSPEIIRRVPQRYIASYLQIKPQSLSRIRKKISSR